MKLAIITYDTNHLKTEQVINNISFKKFDISIFALKFTQRKSRETLFSHRPKQSLGQNPLKLSRFFNYPYTVVNDDTEIPAGYDYYLILGAGILSGQFISGKRVINCHPGIIPNCRGLDSFKWSIFYNRPLGITLHYIDEKVDSGELIAVIPTPVYIEDSLESLAKRHYEMEIGLISNFDHYLKKKVNFFKEIEVTEPKMRMPLIEEEKLNNKFKEFLAKWAT